MTAGRVRPWLLSAPVALAACAGGPQGSAATIVPRAAILYPGTLSVLTSDGGLCAGLRPPGAQAWSGRLQGCRADWAYSVARPARSAREVLEPWPAPVPVPVPAPVPVPVPAPVRASPPGPGGPTGTAAVVVSAPSGSWGFGGL